MNLGLNSTTTPSQLAVLLGSTYPKLTYTLYKIRPEGLYRDFTIPKKNGGVRTISSPDIRLKNLQSKMALLLDNLYKYNSHPAATAFIEGRGLLCNTKPHTKKALVFNIDLEVFFESIHFGRIKGLLTSSPYNIRPDTAQIISTLCCYNRALPQGAPTSPVLSNMVARQLDSQLSHLAHKSFAYYTRYADDITFSFRVLNHEDICIEKNGKYFPSEKLVDIIDKCGFRINETKTRGELSNSRQVVTGLKVNQKVNVDRRYIRTTKAMIHSLSYGESSANKKFYNLNQGKTKTDLKDVVVGRISYIGMIKGTDSTVYQMLAEKFNCLSLDNKMRFNNRTELDLSVKQKYVKKQKFLSNCMWLVEFEGIMGLSEDGEYVQGSAFMVEGQKVLTCDHTFAKAGQPNQCFIFQVHNPSKRYLMNVKSRCEIKDLVELEFAQKPSSNFTFLKIFKDHDLHPGYFLSLVGFPEYISTQNTVTIKDTSVISSFVKSTVQMYEVDYDIVAGYSGGAVINRYMQVVGMIVQGKTSTLDIKAQVAELTGKNLFVGSEAF